jgi:hypothetical protein
MSLKQFLGALHRLGMSTLFTRVTPEGVTEEIKGIYRQLVYAKSVYDVFNDYKDVYSELVTIFVNKTYVDSCLTDTSPFEAKAALSKFLGSDSKKQEMDALLLRTATIKLEDVTESSDAEIKRNIRTLSVYYGQADALAMKFAFRFLRK